jgi:hypothetical protein
MLLQTFANIFAANITANICWQFAGNMSTTFTNIFAKNIIVNICQQFAANMQAKV